MKHFFSLDKDQNNYDRNLGNVVIKIAQKRLV